jgi:glutaminase
VFALYIGRPVSIDEAVYRSERETGHRNRAIGHMLRNFDVLTEDPAEVLDMYFRQCSIAVDCRDLAVMAATLANGGTNPRTGERAVQREYVESMLSLMTTCGMYDFAGEWVYAVGMPAKSGVAGGVLAVLPGQLGIGVFSPRLDARGNSVRGVATCREISRAFGLHFLDVPRSIPSTLRTEYTLASVRSKRLRPEAERAILDAEGERVHVYVLDGDVGFAGVEPVVRRIVQASPAARAMIVDVHRTTAIEPCIAGLVLSLVVDLGERGTPLALVGGERHPGFVRALAESLAGTDQWGRLVQFADVDRALEWAEGILLETHAAPSAAQAAIPLASHDLCHGLDPAALARLESLLVQRRFDAGHQILRRGHPADEIFLLRRGQVSITVDSAAGPPRRLATVSPGMVFGELAVLDRSGRTADAYADTPVDCWVLAADDLDRLGTTHPPIKLRIVENLLRNLYLTMTRLNRELAALAV